VCKADISPPSTTEVTLPFHGALYKSLRMSPWIGALNFTLKLCNYCEVLVECKIRTSNNIRYTRLQNTTDIQILMKYVFVDN
jgi:hypothetical protein